MSICYYHKQKLVNNRMFKPFSPPFSPPVPVGSGPLSSYQQRIPFPGEAGAPPPWDPYQDGSPTNYDIDDPVISPDHPPLDTPSSPAGSPSAPHEIAAKTYLSRRGRGLPPIQPSAPNLSIFNWLTTAPILPHAQHSQKREERCGR